MESPAPRLPDHVECRGVTCDGDAKRTGDLHVVPEGMFFLAYGPEIMRWNPALLLTMGGALGSVLTAVAGRLGAIGGILVLLLPGLLVMLQQRTERKRRQAMARWRSEIAGRPLDELVAENPDSWWLRPEQIQDLVWVKRSVQIWSKEETRVTVGGLQPFQVDALATFAAGQRWPAQDHPSRPLIIHTPCSRSESESKPVWGTLILTPEGIGHVLWPSVTRWIEFATIPLILLFVVSLPLALFTQSLTAFAVLGLTVALAVGIWAWRWLLIRRVTPARGAEITAETILRHEGGEWIPLESTPRLHMAKRTLRAVRASQSDVEFSRLPAAEVQRILAFLLLFAGDRVIEEIPGGG